jgi:hypothetical protein
MSGEARTRASWAPSVLVRRILVGLALLHVASVGMFVWTDFVKRAPADTVASGLRLYQSLSGSFRDYRFFAPSVASDSKAGFLLKSKTGELRMVNFASTNKEINFRYNCIISSMRDERAQDLFARSWAAFLLGANPDADSVAVVVKAFIVPTMADYRRGVQPDWRLVYASEFARTASSDLR